MAVMACLLPCRVVPRPMVGKVHLTEAPHLTEGHLQATGAPLLTDTLVPRVAMGRLLLKADTPTTCHRQEIWVSNIRFFHYFLLMKLDKHFIS